MSSIDEKRVYAAQSGTVTAFVASDLGVAAVSVSDDIVGEFSLVERCTARDVAATDRGLAVATDEDILVGDGETFEATGFGPATAVTGHDGGVLAGDESGAVARYDDGERSEPEWSTLGTCGGVRALDGDLVAASDGVHRITADSLASAGLDDVRDVASAGVPHAATPEGLFRLGNGWLDAIDGDFCVVDATADDAGDLRAAHAATPDAFWELADDDWRERDLPVEESVAGVAYAPGVVLAVTADGTLLADAGDGFRHRALGVPGARAIAVR